MGLIPNFGLTILYKVELKNEDLGPVWYVCLNNNFQFLYKYVCMKKCVKII